MDFQAIMQTDEMNCGAACLCSIANSFGREFELNYIEKLCHIGISGASLLGLHKAAKKIGLHTYPLRISFDVLKHNIIPPFIAHINKSHFVIICSMAQNELLIFDPAVGLVSICDRAFIDRWIGKDASEFAEDGYILAFDRL